jgi:hypothetical protein
LFNYDAPALELVGYFSRSSMASAFSPRELDDTYSAALTSQFQSRMVRADFRKEFSKKWSTLEFDVLLVDFIDERFRLFLDSSGAIVTLSNELCKTGFLKQQRGKVVEPGSDEHFRLWEQGWSVFVQQLHEHGRLDSLRLNPALWSSVTDSGAPLANQDEISTANAYLERLYRRAARDLRSRQVLGIPPELFVGASNHRWGAAPFHYADAYYVRMIELLTAEAAHSPCKAQV